LSKEPTSDSADSTCSLFQRPDFSKSLQRDIFSNSVSSIHGTKHQKIDDSTHVESEHELSPILERVSDSKRRLLDSFDQPTKVAM